MSANTHHADGCAESVRWDVRLELGLDDTVVAVRAGDTAGDRMLQYEPFGLQFEDTHPQITRTLEPSIFLLAR